MRTIVLDTNILIDNVHGFAPWLDRLLEGEDNLVIPTIVIAEYLTATEHEKKSEYEDSKEYFALFNIQELNYQIAEVLGQILRRKTYLQSAGLGDLIIASTALYLDAPLATNNKKDFAKIPKLRFFEWEEV